MDQLRPNHHAEARGPRSRAAGKVTAVLAATLVGAGCYSYQAVDGPAPVAPETIRVQLTGAGQDAMREERGIELQRFEARILEENGDDLTMEVRLPANQLAFSERDVLDTLQVLRPHMRTVDVKQFSTGRTVLAVAGGIAGLAGVYAVVEAAVSSTEEGGDDGGGGGVVVSIVPWITTVMGWLR